DISCEVQRDAVAIADRLKGAIDSLASTAAAGVLAAQRRGRAGATLGELRQRADLVVFWGVDPGARYPRYNARYAVEPVGLAVPGPPPGPGPRGSPDRAGAGPQRPDAVRPVDAPRRRQPLRCRCRAHVADRIPVRGGLRARVSDLPAPRRRRRAPRGGRGGRG